MNQSALEKLIEARNLEKHPDFIQLKNSLRGRISPKMRERYEVIRLFTQCQSISEVGSKLNLDRKTVRKWLTRFQENGIAGLSDLPRSGRRTIIDDDARARIREALASEVPAELGLERWHAKALAQYLNLPYHPVLRYLKSIGVNLRNGS